MDKNEKRNMLLGAIKDYIFYEYDNKLWQREPSAAYTYAKGKLIGMCMALGLELIETYENIKLYYPSGKIYMCVEKAHVVDKSQFDRRELWKIK